MDAQHILLEMEQELISTEKLIQLITEDGLNYRPHPKAMTLGELALHVATIPYNNLGFAKDGEVEATVIVNHPQPISLEEIQEGWNNSKHAIRSILDNTADSWLNNKWKLKNNGNVLAEMDTKGFIRTFVLNHWYHHRGQLSTYLRMLGFNIPSIYGPSADINPFI